MLKNAQTRIEHIGDRHAVHVTIGGTETKITTTHDEMGARKMAEIIRLYWHADTRDMDHLRERIKHWHEVRAHDYPHEYA